MDIGALAQQAISMVAQHLTAVGAGVVDSAEQETVRTLYALVRDRLSRTALGATVLEQLRQQPQDAGRQQLAAAAVTEQAAADPRFAEMLRWSVGSAVQQGFTGQTARHSPVNVTANRDLRMHRSYVAAGDIDNSRRSIRIGVGGWIVAAVLLTAGATTTAVVISDSDDPPAPATIGTDIDDAGVRQTAEAVRDAYADQNSDRLCALSSQKTQGVGGGSQSRRPPEECPRVVTDLFGQMPSSYIQASRTLVVERIGNGTDADDRATYDIDDDEAEVLLVNRSPEAVCQRWKLRLLRENGRWVLNLDSFRHNYLDPDDVC